ncbi:MAG: hypothetical protein MK085_07705 [Phycisphaerales bacterium]|nr:hypothetical protein [Phycisphaerales bacterium]
MQTLNRLFLGVLVSSAAIAQVSDRPWQHDDGTITAGSRTFSSWQEYHQSNLFPEGPPRCGVTAVANQDPAGGGLVGGGPSDCSYSSTNPSDIYDPSVVTYRIPCVVHVIRNSSGSQGDMSIEQVESGIRILNEDLLAIAGTNGENGNDARIEFFLAEVDPSGNPTNGITFSNNDTWFNDSGSYWNSLAWDPNRYLNIYTNSASGALGYVPFLPQDGNVGANEDRVVVLWSTYGEDGPYGPPFDQGRTLTHEVGHYLGLFHVFDGCGGSCSSSGDVVCDTNPQDSPTWGCSSANSCGTPDNIDNYMDYSDDLCMEKFTPEQNRRMRCTLEHYRPQLFTTGPGCGFSCTGDFNEDGLVDGGDLGLLFAAWGPCNNEDPNEPCCKDLNGDGEVSGGDLGALLSSWGECPVDPCADVNCNDNDPCTIDTCVDGECFNEKIPDCGGSGCGDPSSGDCTVPNGTPGCEDAECCEIICAADPYCCETEWDEICAGDAAGQKACGGGGGGGDGCGDPASGSCNQPNGTPYCDDEACCNSVCSYDPYCCETEWDFFCVDEAASDTACGGGGGGGESCGEPDTGSCYEPNNTPYCDDQDCCEAICAVDPFCCETAWDQLCVDATPTYCNKD